MGLAYYSQDFNPRYLPTHPLQSPSLRTTFLSLPRPIDPYFFKPRNHGELPSSLLPPSPKFPPQLTTLPRLGPQQRKSAIDALPVPRRPSRRPRYPRPRPHPPPQSHHNHHLHPAMRKMARPSPQRDLAQSLQDPRPFALRFPNPRSQRRNQ